MMVATRMFNIVKDKKVFMTATGSLSIARSTAVCEKYYAWIIFHR